VHKFCSLLLGLKAGIALERNHLSVSRLAFIVAQKILFESGLMVKPLQIAVQHALRGLREVTFPITGGPATDPFFLPDSHKNQLVRGFEVVPASVGFGKTTSSDTGDGERWAFRHRAPTSRGNLPF
jgi:hypothetical protein